MNSKMDQDDNMQFGITVEQISIDKDQFGNDPDITSLAILPTKNVVLFPGVTISVALKREMSLNVATAASEKGEPIGVVCQRHVDDETPTLSRLYRYGVVADVIKVFELPNGERTALLHGRFPFTIAGVGNKAGHPKGTIVARVTPEAVVLPDDNDRDFPTIIKNIRRLLKKILPAYSDGMAQMVQSLLSDEDPIMLVNVIATNLPFETEEKEKMLGKCKIKDRAMMLLKLLNVKAQELELSMGIMNKVKADLDDDQKRVFLQKQIDVISEQLYGELDDTQELLEKAYKKCFPVPVFDVFYKELTKLRRLNPQNPDYSVAHTYLETLLDLPWQETTKPQDNFTEAAEILDREHCGLEKVKERILEQLAVMIHNPAGRAPILCLVGPPGVGKTSLGKAIAEALCREYQRVSLGGLHDEAEIRGHRRTYIGAMPGRIIDAMRKVGSVNPLLVLDEIDKIGNDYRGDPSSALLEVLDPEQNVRFHDNYVDVDYDLSKVFFIATANTLATVPKPLIDRMEIITLSGYSPEEKLDIARLHLLPRMKKELVIVDDELQISDDAINSIIDNYTSESGVRQLEKAIAKIGRKYLMSKLSKTDFPHVVKAEHLTEILGLPPHIRERYEGNEFAGVVTGLAWTEVGGEILLTEASLSKGKGKETITGNLGQVMKESASIAYQWVKAHASQLGINPELFEKYDLHLHFPEGAIPKDGPSAGITIATSIVSVFTQKRVRKNLAMTGEITLRGKVLPVGGIKEKILAAKRAGITDIIISEENRKDIDDIDAKYLEGVTFHYVKSVLDVMRIAITDEPAVDQITL